MTTIEDIPEVGVFGFHQVKISVQSVRVTVHKPLPVALAGYAQHLVNGIPLLYFRPVLNHLILIYILILQETNEPVVSPPTLNKVPQKEKPLRQIIESYKPQSEKFIHLPRYVPKPCGSQVDAVFLVQVFRP